MYSVIHKGKCIGDLVYKKVKALPKHGTYQLYITHDHIGTLYKHWSGRGWVCVPNSTSPKWEQIHKIPNHVRYQSRQDAALAILFSLGFKI